MVSLLNQTRFVTFVVHFMALNKLHELGLPNSSIPSLAWVTWSVIMIVLFLRCIDKDTILLLLYMDDMIITSDDFSGIQELNNFLSQQFEMKDLGHLNYFLGLEITNSTAGLYITQAKYAFELLSRAGLTDSMTVDIPISLMRI